MDLKNDIYNLIEKQYSKQITEEEALKLKSWYDSSPENRKIYKEYYSVIKYLGISKNKKQFESQVKSAYLRFVGRTGLKVEKRIWKPWLKYAAVFALAFSLGATTYYFALPTSINQGLAQTIEIPFGSKSKITLPDGTSVWLNSGSKLSYQESFGVSDRNISLDGEGYFEVTKNKKLPFKVFSGKVQIKVLGTKFNFKSYAEDENARVTLVEGSLNVANSINESKNILLVPNQQAVINKKRDRVVVKSVDAKSYAMWTLPKQEILDVIPSHVTGSITAAIRVPNITLRNTLFFDEEPLGQIIRDLERAFNVKIEIKDKQLESERFYGDFRNEETITEILDIMATNNNLSYAIKGDEIFITKKMN